MMLLQVQWHSNLKIFMQQVSGVTKRNDQGNSSPRKSKTMQALKAALSQYKQTKKQNGSQEEQYMPRCETWMVLEMCNHDTYCSCVCMCICAHIWEGQRSASSVFKFLCLGTWSRISQKPGTHQLPGWWAWCSPVSSCFGLFRAVTIHPRCTPHSLTWVLVLELWSSCLLPPELSLKCSLCCTTFYCL